MNKKVQLPKKKIRKRLKHWELIAFYLVLYDIFAANASY
ncbi:hypothetical protein M2150_000899 [Lachnospiraceae bacterium PM6-15]